MGKVESCHTHALVNQLLQHWDIPTGRSHGANDFGLTMAGVGFTKNLRQGNVGPAKLRAAGTEFGLRLHGRSESDRIQIEEEFTD